MINDILKEKPQNEAKYFEKKHIKDFAVYIKNAKKILINQNEDHLAGI